MGHSHNHNDTSQLFGIAALAAGVGALTALLFSKQSGAETREALRAKIRDIKAKPSSLKQDINEAADNAAETAEKIKDQFKDKADKS